MSTINPGLIDTSVPPDGSGDPDNPVDYFPVTERDFKAVVQGLFGDAANDVDVNAAALSAHKAAGGGAEHPNATVGTSGFVGPLNGDAQTFWAGTGAYLPAMSVSADNETGTGRIAAAVVEALPGVPVAGTVYFVMGVPVP